MSKAIIPAAFISAVLALLLFTACNVGENTAYSHFEEIPVDGWDPVDILIFEPRPADSVAAMSRTYSMDLILRYSARKDIAMLPVVMTIENDSGELRCDTILLHPDSVSRGMSGRIKYGVHEVTFNLDSAVRLSEGYTVSLMPLSPKENTDGLLNIGLTLK